MWSRATAEFDDTRLVSSAGLVPVMALAERAGLSDLIEDKVVIASSRVASAGVNPAGNLTSIIAGMAAGADSIDDLQVIRSGGIAKLFGGCTRRRRWVSSCVSSPTATLSSCRRCCARI